MRWTLSWRVENACMGLSFWLDWRMLYQCHYAWFAECVQTIAAAWGGCSQSGGDAQGSGLQEGQTLYHVHPSFWSQRFSASLQSDKYITVGLGMSLEHHLVVLLWRLSGALSGRLGEIFTWGGKGDAWVVGIRILFWKAQGAWPQEWDAWGGAWPDGEQDWMHSHMQQTW